VILSTKLSSVADLFKDKLTLPQFLSGLAKWAQGLPKDPAQWEIGDLKRQSDGAFQDGELVELLRVATENVAGKFSLQCPRYSVLTFFMNRCLWSSQYTSSYEGYRVTRN